MSSSKRPAANKAGGLEGLARRFLTFGVRSRAELAAYLAGRGASPEETERLTREFTTRGLLDDRACAKLTATRLADDGFAARLIRARLLEKGLDAALIDAILPGVAPPADDAVRARTLVLQQLPQSGPSRRHARARLARLLASRGHDADLSESLLADILGPASDSIHADE